MKILIVKTSSLGDIIQTFHILKYLKNLKSFKHSKEEIRIDWVVEKRCKDLVENHPLVDNAISFERRKVFNRKGFIDLKKTFNFFKNLRKTKYDILFDLQGNLKSSIITFFAKSKDKVGFGFSLVPEKINLFFTNIKISNIDKKKNIRIQYLLLIKEYFKDFSNFSNFSILEIFKNFSLKISKDEREKVLKISKNLKNLKEKFKILIFPFSKWENKEIKIPFLIEFLHSVKEFKKNSFFIFLYGNEKEKIKASFLHEKLKKESVLLEPLKLSSLQNIMKEIDLVLSTDSALLHLSEFVENLPSFSIFAPTSSNIFKPISKLHFAFQRKCPYGKTFVKRCSLLRKCKNADCIKKIEKEEVFESFKKFLESSLKK